MTVGGVHYIGNTLLPIRIGCHKIHCLNELENALLWLIQVPYVTSARDRLENESPRQFEDSTQRRCSGCQRHTTFWAQDGTRPRGSDSRSSGLFECRDRHNFLPSAIP